MACCKDGFCQEGTRDRAVPRGQFRPPALPVPGCLVSPRGSWGAREGGEAASSPPLLTTYPSWSEADLPILTTTLWAEAKVCRDYVEPKTTVGIGVHAAWLRDALFWTILVFGPPPPPTKLPLA